MTNEHAPDTKAVILFDGACVLCNGFAHFVARHDSSFRYLFASFQSPAGLALSRSYGLPTQDYGSLALIEGGRCHVQSAAVARVLWGLDRPWSALAAIWIVPSPLRDAVYRFVGHRRIGWFGEAKQCVTAEPEFKRRIL
jgi:predicted DCC family thiol-disulfide oxidoreductase YuxK